MSDAAASPTACLLEHPHVTSLALCTGGVWPKEGGDGPRRLHDRTQQQMPNKTHCAAFPSADPPPPCLPDHTLLGKCRFRCVEDVEGASPCLETGCLSALVPCPGDFRRGGLEAGAAGQREGHGDGDTGRGAGKGLMNAKHAPVPPVRGCLASHALELRSLFLVLPHAACHPYRHKLKRAGHRSSTTYKQQPAGRGRSPVFSGWVEQPSALQQYHAFFSGRPQISFHACPCYRSQIDSARGGSDESQAQHGSWASRDHGRGETG